MVKPCKQSEIDFYESTSSHPNFAVYIPAYLGTLHLGDSAPVQAAGALLLPADTSPDLPSSATFGGDTLTIENEWTPSGGGKIQTDLAIVLENVALDYKRPNILDVKLGARLWADDAPPAKRAKLDKAAEETTSKPLGFRIAGGKVYQSNGLGDNATSDGYKLFDKNYGRALSPDTVRKGFEDYFLLTPGEKAKPALRKVIRRFLLDLKGMIEAIETEESRMYSASLLFVYEGDAEALEQAFLKEKDVLEMRKARQESYTDGDDCENDKSFHAGDHVSTDDEGEEEESEYLKFPAVQSLKLIDFAHAQWTPGHGPDENILHGIRNVSTILGEILG